MATSEGPAHLLSLKVMRVSRPELASAWQPFYSSSPSFSAHSSASILSLQGSIPLPGHPKTLRDLTHSSEVLTLPSSFGSIKLGETFSSSLCVNNETEVDIEVVQIKIEMQTISSKVVLLETDNDNLNGGDTLEHVVHHEIKELGQHVLACTITYSLPFGSRSIPGGSEDPAHPNLQTFRKFYKFAVTNPLSVKTKVHSPKSPSALLFIAEREKIFLEVHIQNLTQDSITFEKMRLECTDGWEAVDGNVNNDQESLFSGSMSFMQAQDTRQYIYTLVPKKNNLFPVVHAPGSVIPIGRLDISWRSSLGEPGRLLTSMLSRRIPIVPVFQPASGLSPHVKRASAALPLSRPHSPLLGQSRPQTPNLSNFQMPGSPELSSNPFVQQTNTPSPDIEVQLVVSKIPNKIILEKAFSVSFAVLVSSNVPEKQNLKRRVKLAIQNITPRTAISPIIAAVNEGFNSQISYSGYSTPLSAATALSYPLTHQKVLNSPKLPSMHSSASPDLRYARGENSLPPPFFETEDSGLLQSSNKVVFIGASTLKFLLELSTGDDSEAGEQKTLHAVEEFEMTYLALRAGFSTIGGIRILLIDDQDDSLTLPQPTHILKEYRTVAEVWVSA